MSITIDAPNLPSAARAEVVYPEDDGNSMSGHTLQFCWIVTIKEGLEALFADVDDVFVAGDLLWYPVEGENKTRIAPDAMVAFGRPKGERGSYQQWREGDVAPQVVFEVASTEDSVVEMCDKYRFYACHGVEEYYLYDSFNYEFCAWVRPEPESPFLERIDFTNPFVSPRLGLRFVAGREEQRMHIFRPDGKLLATLVELGQAHRSAEQRASAEAERANQLAAQLRALGIDPQL